MPKRNQVNGQDVGTETIFQQCDAMIHRGVELKDQELGLTKDGRRRWKVRPKALIHHDRKQIAAALRLKGKTWREIADVLGVTESAVTQWCKDDNYKAFFADLLMAYKEEQRHAILNYVPDAIRTLHDLLNDRSGHVRYEAAQALITHAALDQQVAQASSDGDLWTRSRSCVARHRRPMFRST